jgi:signal transduction histidine kinase
MASAQATTTSVVIGTPIRKPMKLTDIALSLHESATAGEALALLAEGVGGGDGCSAVWLDGDNRPVHRHPPEADLPQGSDPESASPSAAAAIGPSRSFRLPLAGGGLVVIIGSTELDPDQPGWSRVAVALERVAHREAELADLRAQRDEERRRAEESEALHVLGLAANRSLDSAEVLTLIARAARTLLGAHYALVGTAEGEHLRVMSTYGLRAAAPESDDLGHRAMTSGRPVRVETGGSIGPAEFPFHTGEGMLTGLAVPLALFGETFGALTVGYRRDYHLTARDERLALSLAGHAAVAISNARLHGALAERSRELERAYQELRRNAEGKERYFASMSHELRTPLNAILGYQSLLLDEVPAKLPPALRPFLENANRAARGLLLLVNDILDLSKLEAGKMELLLRPTALPDVIADAVATVKPLAAARGIPLRTWTAADLPEIVTDADRVRQILVNLLSNAVKFADEGGIEICAVRGDSGTTSEHLQVRVADTGRGIAEEDQERIFHEFEQVSGPVGTVGTGLGLPISRKLARLLGGDLLLASSFGVGSTFTLQLPRDLPAD